MKKPKKSTAPLLNKVGIRVLQPTASKGRSIGQNLDLSRKLIRKADTHDAGGPGTLGGK